MAKEIVNRQRMQEFQEEWHSLTEEIAALKKDIANQIENHPKVVLRRRLQELENQREHIEVSIERIESGEYLPAREIIGNGIINQKKQIVQAIQKRQKVVNSRPLIVLQNFKNRSKELDTLRKYILSDEVCLINVVGQPGIGKSALISKLFSEIENDNITIIHNDIEKEISGIIFFNGKNHEISLGSLYENFQKIVDEETSLSLKQFWLNPENDLLQKAEFLLSTLKPNIYIIFIDSFESLLNENLEVKNEELRKFIEIFLVIESKVNIILTSNCLVDISINLSQRSRKLLIKEGLSEVDAVEYLKCLDVSGDIGIKNTDDASLLELAKRVEFIPNALDLIANLLATDLSLSVTRLLDDKKLFSGKITSKLLHQIYKNINSYERLVLEVIAIYKQDVEFIPIASVVNKINPDIDVNKSLKWLIGRLIVVIDDKQRCYGIRKIFKEFVLEMIDVELQLKIKTEIANYYKSIQFPLLEINIFDKAIPHIYEFEYRIDVNSFSSAFNIIECIEVILKKLGHNQQLLHMRLKLSGNLSDKKYDLANSREIGKLYAYMGKHENSLQHFLHSKSICEELGDEENLGYIIGDIGLANYSLSNYNYAMQCYKESLKLAIKFKNLSQESHILGCKANAYRRLNMNKKSLSLFEKALKLDRKSNNENGISRRLFDLGITNLQEGRYEQAKEYLTECLSLVKNSDNFSLHSSVLGNLGFIYLLQNNSDLALENCSAALLKAKLINSKRSEGRQTARLGDIFFLKEDYQEAFKLHDEAINLAIETNDFDGICIWSSNAGYDLVCLKKFDLAKSYFEKSIEKSQELFTKNESWHNMTRYYYGLSLLGIGICDSMWDDVGYQDKVIVSALNQFSIAKGNGNNLNINKQLLIILEKLEVVTSNNKKMLSLIEALD